MLEPDDRGVGGTLAERQVSRTQAVGRAFQDADPAGAYMYQTIPGLGADRPSYRESFAAAQAAPIPLDGLRALGVPVLFGRGESDHVADGTALAELAALIPEATTVTLAGYGHSRTSKCLRPGMPLFARTWRALSTGTEALLQAAVLLCRGPRSTLSPTNLAISYQ
jgi:hypothetical protein